jgi:hypothetical protein
VVGGSDIDLKAELGLYPSSDEEWGQREQRQKERTALLRTFRSAGLLADRDDDVSVNALFTAAHAFLARTPSVLALAQIDDVTAERDPVNVPATTDEYPNWRRKTSVPVEELAALPLPAHARGGLRASRSRPSLNCKRLVLIERASCTTCCRTFEIRLRWTDDGTRLDAPDHGSKREAR